VTGLRRTTRLAAAGVATLVLLAGCGSDEPPSSAVPELATRLGAIDGALANGRFAVARDELGSLGQDTAAALEDGDLEPEQAERILDAVKVLLDALPSPAPAQQSTEEPTPVPTEEASEESQDDDDQVDETKPPKEPKGKGKKGR